MPSIFVPKTICSVGNSASLIEEPGALNFVRSNEPVTKALAVTGIKVASPQLITDLPIVASIKLSPTSKSVVMYAFNKVKSCSREC